MPKLEELEQSGYERDVEKEQELYQLVEEAQNTQVEQPTVIKSPSYSIMKLCLEVISDRGMVFFTGAGSLGLFAWAMYTPRWETILTASLYTLGVFITTLFKLWR